jgi:hypothetical protein
MNMRKTLSVLSFVALAVPLAALADAPSGDFEQLFPRSSADTPAPSAAERAENNKSAEYSIGDLVGPESAEVTREDVRKALVESPMGRVEA